MPVVGIGGGPPSGSIQDEIARDLQTRASGLTGCQRAVSITPKQPWTASGPVGSAGRDMADETVRSNKRRPRGGHAVGSLNTVDRKVRPVSSSGLSWTHPCLAVPCWPDMSNGPCACSGKPVCSMMTAFRRDHRSWHRRPHGPKFGPRWPLDIQSLAVSAPCRTDDGTVPVAGAGLGASGRVQHLKLIQLDAVPK